MQKNLLLCIAFIATCHCAFSQGDSSARRKKWHITGTAGISYEGYGLDVKPDGSGIYSPRKPWNQVRFVFTPVLQAGDFTLPINFNFAAMATNFAGPYAGLKNQSVAQFFTNPANNFGLNPKYKWAELQLGTQYLHYSDLSTGDIGIFGAGVDLKPGIFRVKFFTGVSQLGVDAAVNNPMAPMSTGSTGAYKRKHWMTQLGIEKENKYNLAVTLASGKDDPGSVTIPPSTIKPQEGVVGSIIGDLFFSKGWFIRSEFAKAWFTKDLSQPFSTGMKNSFEPFITGRTSTNADLAANFSVGKKSTNFDIGYTSKYVGAGFQTTGYPYLQADIWDNTLNTRFGLWKQKMNLVVNIGNRVNNLSNTSTKANQFIANLNWFTQFSEKFNLTLTYNNFGFTTASGLNPYGIRNVSTDMGANAVYSWAGKKQMNVLNFNYNYSRYNERDVITGVTTANNTHSVLMSYVPAFFNSPVSPDFSAIYFNNQTPVSKYTMFTLSSAVSAPAFKKKMQLRAQLQYSLGRLSQFNANNNLIASLNMDYKLSKKLLWNVYLASNYYKYGNELTPPATLDGARYLESNYRTGLQYKF
jgi:hypothetical protein